MKKSTIVLLVLLLIDVVTTLYLLRYIPNTVELNPLLNQFGNVFMAVILSHIFAAIIVIALDIQSFRLDDKENRRLDIFMILVIFFYIGVVVFNGINIVLGHLFYI